MNLFRRLNSIRLMRLGTCLTEENIESFVQRIRHVIRERGHCVIAVSGSPGSGKSVYANSIRRNGFFSFSKERVSVIDDLKGNNNERYSRKVLKEVKIEHEKCLLFIFDYRAAVYCNSADFYLIKDILEDKRLKNLKKRSMRSYKRYRGFFYRYPPIPFRVDPSKVYIWKDDSIELFKG
jgi:hypothetical protein